MRMELGLAFICAFLPGCELVSLASQNLAFGTVEYTDRHLTHLRHQGIAEMAWKRLRGSDKEIEPSEDYAKGFKEGFTAYLDVGGTPTPPSLPPTRYWTRHFQNPEGHKAIEDWFAGFQWGAAEAEATGLRTLSTVPASQPALTEAQGDMLPIPPESLPQAEVEPVLPPPQKLQPPTSGDPAHKPSPAAVIGPPLKVGPSGSANNSMEPTTSLPHTSGPMSDPSIPTGDQLGQWVRW